MRRRFSEVRRETNIEEAQMTSRLGYQQIKSETDITVEEARQFLDDFFSRSIGERVAFAESLPEEIVIDTGVENLPEEITL